MRNNFYLHEIDMFIILLFRYVFIYFSYVLLVIENNNNKSIPLLIIYQNKSFRNTYFICFYVV